VTATATTIDPAAVPAPAQDSPSGPVPTARPSEAFLERVSHEYARHHLVLSAGVEDGVEVLLISDRTKPTAPFNVGVLLERPIRTEVAPAEAIAAAVDRAYSDAAGHAEPDSDAPAVTVHGSDDVAGDLDAAVREAERDLLSTAGKAPAVRLVDLILFEALLRGASDVHVQPLRDRTLVRYRLDGSLHTVRELPGGLAASVVSRVKVMANLDIAERRAPQDGRATVTIGGAGGGHAGRRVDLRVSTLPSTYGERVVLRLLDPARSPHLSSFAALGMPPEVERAYLEQVSRTSGIVLSTGPTGSGKTTTLYATLAWVSSTNTQGGVGGVGGPARGCELNMMTVEDPVEYDLSGSLGVGGAGLAVSQTQVDPKKGVTFVTGLRHILRQDPDVIMVGEIRDEETARIAVQASLTGHLVLSTLHTSDSASAVARLLDLGVEPFLVSSSLSAALAQRLVRTLHKPCAGRGCDECLGAGFKGRTGVFELLVLDHAIRDLVGRRPPASAVEIKTAARRGGRGMATLREAGETLVREGVTSIAELTRVIDANEELET
jgi:general secretion pathway protein E